MYPEKVARYTRLLALLLYAVAAPAQPNTGQSSPDTGQSQANNGLSQANNGLCKEVPTIAAELTQISGMPLRHAVPCDFITKAKINEFLNKRVKEETKPDEIRAEELTLKKFGLVPQEFDLAKTTIDLLTEQAAAFYDYDKKKLFITETPGADPQEPVLAHELS